MKKAIQSPIEKEKFFIKSFIKEYFNYYYFSIREKEFNTITLIPNLIDGKNYVNSLIKEYNTKIQFLDDFDNGICRKLIEDFRVNETIEFESNLKRIKSKWAKLLSDNYIFLCDILNYTNLPSDTKCKDWIRDEESMRLERNFSEQEIQEKLHKRSIKVSSEVYELKQNDTIQYEFDGIWSFEFNKYKSYRNSNRKIEILLNHCELFVYLVNVFTLESYLMNCGDNIEGNKDKGKSEKEHKVIEKNMASNSKSYFKIMEIINKIDVNVNWKYAFKKESDFIHFSNVLSKFFESEDYAIPKEIIKLNKSCKTRLALTLKEVHTELSENKLKSDIEYFKILRILEPFNKLTDTQIYSSLIK